MNVTFDTVVFVDERMNSIDNDEFLCIHSSMLNQIMTVYIKREN